MLGLSIRKMLFSLLFLFFSAAVLNPVLAAEQINYYVSATETVSNNILKSYREESGTTEMLALGAAGSKSFNSLSTGVNGQVSYTRRDETLFDSARDDRLAGSAFLNVRLLPDTLNWSNTVTASSVWVDPSVSSNRDNVSDTTTVTTSPELSVSLGKVDQLTASSAYSYSNQSALYDSERMKHSLNWQHTLKYGHLSLNGQYQEVDNEFANSDYNTKDISTIFFRQWRTVSLRTQLGITKIAYDNLESNTTSEIIAIRTSWIVSPITDINASFDRSAADSVQEFSIPLAETSNVTVSGYASGLTETDNTSLSLLHQIGHNNVLLDLSHIARTSLIGNNTLTASDEKKVTLMLEGELSKLTGLKFLHNYREVEFGSGIVTENNLTRLTVTRHLRPRLSLRTEVRYETQASQFALANYDELAGVISIRYSGFF